MCIYVQRVHSTYIDAIIYTYIYICIVSYNIVHRLGYQGREREKERVKLNPLYPCIAYKVILTNWVTSVAKKVQWLIKPLRHFYDPPPRKTRIKNV